MIPDDYLTAAFHRPYFLPNAPQSRARTMAKFGVGSKVVLIRMKLDRRFKIAAWVIAASVLLSIISLVVGITVQGSETAMTIFATNLSLVGAFVASLNWIHAG